MKISTKIVINQPEGKPYKDTDDLVLKDGMTKDDVEKAINKGPDLTIGKVISKTLATVKSTDPWKSYRMTNEFLKSEADITSEDITFIKELIKEADYKPYIIGSVIDILENPPVSKKK